MTTISSFRITAWQKLAEKWSDMAVAQLISLVCALLLLPTGIGGLIVTGPFTIGLTAVSLSLVRYNHVRLSILFHGFRRSLGNSIVLYLMTLVYTLLWSLLLLPGLVKHYSYAMAPFILTDNPKMDPTAALQTSEKMMNGHKWRLFCLDVTFLGWGLLTVLTFGIASIWTAPYHRTARAEFYLDLKSRFSDDGYYYEPNA